MSCGCSGDTCPPSGEICVPAGDGCLLVFSVYDEDGDLFDISGSVEITFLVATSREGTVVFSKTMTGGDIAIAGNDYQFSLTVFRADTELLINQKNYYEATVETSGGIHKTVSAGVFSAPKTLNKDLP